MYASAVLIFPIEHIMESTMPTNVTRGEFRAQYKLSGALHVQADQILPETITVDLPPTPHPLKCQVSPFDELLANN